MPRSSWKGFIKLSLVSIPVKGYTALTSSGGHIRLNQLHETCNSRIKYQKVCPIHGEVPRDEIVMGYEYAKDEYAVIDLAELDKLRSESDRSINLDQFIRPDQLDPLHYSGKSYFLAPDGPAGQKPYALLCRAMTDENLYGIAQVMLSGKEYLVVLRPIENLLTISVLYYDAEVKKPESFSDEVTEGEVSSEELALAKMLIQATTANNFDLAAYKDLFTERLTQLIEAKVQGQEIVAAPREEGPAVINLIEALKASVQRAKQDSGKPAEEPPKTPSKKKMAGSARQRKTSRKKKKKTG